MTDETKSGFDRRDFLGAAALGTGAAIAGLAASPAGAQPAPGSTGLVDFPYDRDGRIVYLCWKPDEDEIGWWHETDAGFAGRQMLTDEFE